MVRTLSEELVKDAESNLGRGLSCYGEQRYSEAVVYSAISIELLLKSVLAQANPALLADPQHRESLVWFATQANGGERPANLRTISAKDAVSLVKRLGHGGGWQHSAVDDLFGYRNQYVHLGGTIAEASARTGVASAVAVSQILLPVVSVDFDAYLEPHRELALSLVGQQNDEISSLLNDLLREAQNNDPWLKGEQLKAFTEASTVQLEMRREVPHHQIVVCPACNLPALVEGEVYEAGWDVDVDRYGDPISAHLMHEFHGALLRCPTCELVLNRPELVEASGVLEDWELSNSDYEFMLASYAWDDHYG